MSNFSVYAQYCDDIRKEENGKVSLMGVMPGGLPLLVPKKPVVRKLSVFVTIVVGPDEPLDPMTIEILLNNTVLKESAVPEDLLKHLGHQKLADSVHASRVINFATSLYDVDVSAGGSFRTVVKSNAGVVEALSLRIMRAKSASKPPIPTTPD